MTTRPIEFSDDGKELYWLDSRGRDKAAVVAQDMASGAHARACRRRAGGFFDALIQKPVSLPPLAASSTYLRRRLARARCRLCRRFRGDRETLGRRCPVGAAVQRHAQLARLCRARCRARPVSSTTIAPAKKGRMLFVTRPALAGGAAGADAAGRRHARATASISSATCRARASTRRHAGADGAAGARRAVGRATSGRFNSAHQWLANRGYAVLSVNFRGSTGFGKAFVNAANLEWGGKMHDDLIDAVDWAIAQKHRRAEQGRDLRRKLRRLRGAGRRDLHAGEIRLRHRRVRHLQPEHHRSNTIPTYWKPWTDGVEGADGRLHHGRGPEIPGGAFAAQSRRPHRAAAADRARAQTTCA